jgi:hypothetical protein
MKKHISKIGLVVTLIGAAAILLYAASEVRTAGTLKGFGLEQNRFEGSLIGSHHADVALTADQFNSATQMFSGDATVRISPNSSPNAGDGIVYPSDEPEQTFLIKHAILSLGHREEIEGKPSIIEYGSSKPIELTRNPRWAEVNGTGAYSWRTQSTRSSFWYPFDGYSLYINPTLITGTETEGVVQYGPIEPIETFSVELRVPNFRMNVIRKESPERGGDRYRVEFARPIVLRIITVTIGILAVVWLTYLALFADTGSHIGELVTFFLGIWGVRSTLLGNLSVFPIMLDYATLVLAVVAVGIVVSKWAQVRASAFKCPHCRVSISPDASRCPNCTSNLPQA